MKHQLRGLNYERTKIHEKFASDYTFPIFLFVWHVAKSDLMILGPKMLANTLNARTQLDERRWQNGGHVTQDDVRGVILQLLEQVLVLAPVYLVGALFLPFVCTNRRLELRERHPVKVELRESLVIVLRVI